MHGHTEMHQGWSAGRVEKENCGQGHSTWEGAEEAGAAEIGLASLNNFCDFQGSHYLSGICPGLIRAGGQ